MQNIAYIRVSDSKKQDSSAQRQVISDYAEKHKIIVTSWREFHLSGSKTDVDERGITELLSELKKGDKVLVSDVARLGRDNVSQVLNTITGVINVDAEIHFCYSDSKLTKQDQNDLAKIFMLIGEAFAAVKFSEERSRKAKAACKVRTMQGLRNGRQKGKIVKSKFDEHAPFIINEIEAGTPKTEILRLLEKKKGVKGGRTAFYDWMRTRMKK